VGEKGDFSERPILVEKAGYKATLQTMNAVSKLAVRTCPHARA